MAREEILDFGRLGAWLLPFASMEVFSTENFLPYHSEGGGHGVFETFCLPLSLLQWNVSLMNPFTSIRAREEVLAFAAMAMLLNEEILPNYRQGGGPGVCETSHLLEEFSMKTFF